MNRVRYLGPTSVLTLFVATLLTACSSTGATPPVNASGAASGSYPTTTPSTTTSSTTTPSAVSTAVPAEVSDFPDGVYRTQLTRKRLQELGFDDLSNGGTWTLTVKSGNYQLDCRVLADPGVDCGSGDHGGSTTVEMGTLHGTSPTVWFVHDMARLSKVTGCVRGSNGSRGCGPEGGYHLNWKKVPNGMAFSEYVGLGDEAGAALANWVGQPWTRIS